MQRLILFLLFASFAFAQAYRDNRGFAANALRNDDDNFAEVQLPFPVNFGGRVYNSVFISNNGNLSFGTITTVLDGRANFVPRGIRNINFPMIAPFYADIDTSNSSAVTYGADRVDNRVAFGVNWPGVGRFDRKNDRLNTFQVVLVERADTGTGNFDIEFNYSSINWDTGDDTVLGTAPASAGFTNGLGGDNGQLFEFPGSLTTGAFLDDGPFALRTQSRNSGVAGRLRFEVRNGLAADTSLVIDPSRTRLDCPNVTIFARGSGYRVDAFVTPNFVRSLTENGEARTITNFVALPAADGTPNTYDFQVTYRSTPQIDPAGNPFPLSQVRLNVSLAAFGNRPEFTASDTKNVRNCALSTSCGTIPTTALVGFQFNGRASASGGIAPYTFSAANIPPGTVFAANGTLSGAVNAPGDYSFVVTARDASSPVQSASTTCRMSVTGQASPVTGACNTPPATAGAPYTGSINASGGRSPYSFRIFEGALPPGLALNETSGAITGTVAATAAGAYPFSVSISDSAQGRTSVACSITVNTVVVNPPQISSFAPAAVTAGSAAFTLRVSGNSFSSASRFVWNGFELTTTFVSATALDVAVPANLLAAEGTAQVLVRNSASLSSAAAAYEVYAVLSGLAINPSELRATGEDTAVTLSGNGFWPGMMVALAGANLSVRRISANQAEFVVPGARLAAPGTLTFTVTNPDGRSTTVSANVVPALTLGPSLTIENPNVITDQNAVTVRLAQAPGRELRGTLRIAFSPAADGEPNNGDTDFPRFNGANNRLLTFAIAANATEFRAAIDQGSVAGTGSVSLETLTADGVTVLAGAPPVQAFTIARSAPFLLPGSVAVVRTANGIAVEALAISSVRNLTSGTVSFTLASGVQAGSSLSFPVENLAAQGAAWFGSAAGRNAGGAFRISIPFTFEGDFANLQGVSLTLSNSVGASATVTGGRR
ncbi:MAG: putative Ig domain-containing protein [Bryobacter sp.]|nr:putative Ig domain-containing protein [Bryobacter sp.]